MQKLVKVYNDNANHLQQQGASKIPNPGETHGSYSVSTSSSPKKIGLLRGLQYIQYGTLPAFLAATCALPKRIKIKPTNSVSILYLSFP